MPRMTLEYRYQPTPPKLSDSLKADTARRRFKSYKPYDKRFHHHIEVVFDKHEWDGRRNFMESCVYPGSVLCYHMFGLGNYDLRDTTFMFRTKADALLFKLSHVQSQA